MSDSPVGNSATPERSIGLLGATAVGIGAIVGGGILVLAGVAFRATGPAAMLVFALNGVIAVIIEQAKRCDLVVLGLQRGRGGTRSFSEVARRVAYESPCAVVLISQGERN